MPETKSYLLCQLTQGTNYFDEGKKFSPGGRLDIGQSTITNALDNIKL